MIKITFSEKTNELMISFGGFKILIIIDSAIFSNSDQYIARIKEFNLEKLSVDNLIEVNKLVFELRDSLNVNPEKKDIKILQKASKEIQTAILLIKLGIPYVSGSNSGVAVEEAANC